MKEKLLIIDDEEDICSSLTFALEDKYDVCATTNPLVGMERLIKEDFSLVLLDLKIGHFDGIDFLEEIKNIDSNIQVIMMTAFGSIVSSVDAIKKGAYTYLTKPLSLDNLYDVIEQALNDRIGNTVIKYNIQNTNQYEYYGIIGKSPAMQKVFQYIEKLKDVDTSVVIIGESGTGKELVARAIHDAGKRKNSAFVDINCAAIPDSLLEEELFGHKKGTFTGAVSDKIGKFEYAHNGTIFLDEIGDMPLNLQAKLLRVLQQKSFTPLGSNTPIKTNVRVIAATNQDVKKLVETGRFRNDLYFRLNVINISMPPLREKKQDLSLLSQFFIEMYNRSLEKSVEGLTKEAQDLLFAYDYPGNVRELSNIIECAVLLSKDALITTEDLPIEVNVLSQHEDDILDLNIATKLGVPNLIGLTLQEAEKELIKAALKINKSHRKATATMLGISERGLRNKIQEYDLKKDL
jgi:two-component system response regulator AtoC